MQYIDSNGHERIIVSGGRDGTESLYNFIETGLKQIKDWGDDDITWVVANWNYSIADRVAFTKTAIENGINFTMIDDKQELFDYINKDGREDDPIEAMSFFAHGTGFDQEDGVPNSGYENKYALAMGYSAVDDVNHNNNLNIFVSDLCKINASAFSKSSYTYFGSCRTGNEFNNSMSFAQVWANLTGGSVKAATGTSNDNGRTNYKYIYSKGKESNWNITVSIKDRLSGTSKKRSEERSAYGFSTSGCLNYPVVDDGGSFKILYANH